MNENPPTINDCPLCGAAAAAYHAGTARCRACGFVFGLPYCSGYGRQCALCRDKCFQSESGLPAHYARRTAAMRLKVEAGRLQRLARLAGPLRGLEILEVGAGAGALASLLIEAGVLYEGYELSPQLYAESLRQFPITAGRITNAAPPEEAGRRPRDLALAVDVLEYIAGPAAFLSKLAATLKPDGAVYVEVPDESFFRLRTAARKALRLYQGPVHPGHINFFSMGTLLAAADRAGLRAKSAGRLSLLADAPRLEATLGSPLPLWARAASAAARLTRADLALGQGNLYALLRRAGGKR